MDIEKKRPKLEREKDILLGLVDLYIKTGKPIGSKTLQENGFEYVSPATIRNYFAKWEKLGFLSQQHCSGGRIPTTLALRKYVNAALKNPKNAEKSIAKLFEKELVLKDKEIMTLLQKSAEKLSELTGGAVFLLTPYFDQDFIQTIKLIPLSEDKLLALLVTDFGEIKTETVYVKQKLTPDELKYLEQFLMWKIGKAVLEKKNDKLIKLAQKIYTEIMLRQVASHNKKEPIYRTGLSKLLQYSAFEEPLHLIKTLTLFEDQSQMLSLLKESLKLNQTTCWISEELSVFGHDLSEVAVIADTYKIAHLPVGAVAILVPKKAPYATLFGILTAFTSKLSNILSCSVAKLKIPFGPGHFSSKASALENGGLILLENKNK